MRPLGWVDDVDRQRGVSMNRILQAEVILTLTLEQASRVAAVLSFYRRDAFGRAGEQAAQYQEALAVVLEQCKRQGVCL